MAAVGRGELARLGELFRRHHLRVHAYCARITADPDVADDLVQEVFLRVARAAPAYRERSRFLPWLYSIARSACIEHLRTASRRRRLLEKGTRRLEEAARRRAGSGAPQSLDEEERTALLDAALAELPTDAREVIVLARFVGLSGAELAETLECSPGAARVRLHRALGRLAELCRAKEEERDGVRALP